MTALEYVVARLPDGRILTFEDGEVTGDAELIAALERQTDRCTLVIGLSYDAQDFRESGNAFKAATMALAVDLGYPSWGEGALAFPEDEGCEPVPPGDLIIPGPEHDRSVAEYRAEMRAWRARRRRLGAKS